MFTAYYAMTDYDLRVLIKCAFHINILSCSTYFVLPTPYAICIWGEFRKVNYTYFIFISFIVTAYYNTIFTHFYQETLLKVPTSVQIQKYMFYDTMNKMEDV